MVKSQGERLTGVYGGAEGEEEGESQARDGEGGREGNGASREEGLIMAIVGIKGRWTSTEIKIINN